MVSYPSYENNRLARFIPQYYYEQLSQDLRNPLLNHAVGDELPAGSVFKLVTAVGALNEGVVTPEQIIKTPPKITIEDKSVTTDIGARSKDFIDWNKAGFGELDFPGFNSSNVYFTNWAAALRMKYPKAWASAAWEPMPALWVMGAPQSSCPGGTA
jgi:penicillin-binding protein 2